MECPTPRAGPIVSQQFLELPADLLVFLVRLTRRRQCLVLALVIVVSRQRRFPAARGTLNSRFAIRGSSAAHLARSSRRACIRSRASTASATPPARFVVAAAHPQNEAREEWQGQGRGKEWQQALPIPRTGGVCLQTRNGHIAPTREGQVGGFGRPRATQSLAQVNAL